MFGFNKKNNDNDNDTDDFYRTYDKLQKALRESRKEYFEWLENEEHKRFEHLQILIVKTYETVNIKAELLGTRLNESFTREDYIEDFRMFFKPEVFKKLSDWCKEYEMFREKEQKLLNNLV